MAYLLLVSLALCLWAELMISPTYAQGDWCKTVGGVRIYSRCLTFSEEKRNWYDSQAACVSKGGHLPSLSNYPQAQELLIYVNINYDGVSFWVGGTDIANEGSWVWLNGKPFDQFPWSQPADNPHNHSQPDNYGGEQHCLHVGWFNGYDDGVCTYEFRYICELGGFGGGSSSGGGGPVVPILADDRDGPHADGSYSFNFESEDGTSVQEQGYPTDSGAVAQRGSYTLTYPDGTVGEFKWIADENGFRVESPLLPTPPPIPPHAQVV